MALLKPIETPAGAAASYWRITHVAIDLVARSIAFRLTGYLDQAARDAGKDPLAAQDFTRPLAEGEAPEQIGRAELYAVAAASETQMFEGAADV